MGDGLKREDLATGGAVVLADVTPGGAVALTAGEAFVLVVVLIVFAAGGAVVLAGGGAVFVTTGVVVVLLIFIVSLSSFLITDAFCVWVVLLNNTSSLFFCWFNKSSNGFPLVAPTNWFITLSFIDITFLMTVSTMIIYLPLLKVMYYIDTYFLPLLKVLTLAPESPWYFWPSACTMLSASTIIFWLS